MLYTFCRQQSAFSTASNTSKYFLVYIAIDKFIYQYVQFTHDPFTNVD